MNKTGFVFSGQGSQYAGMCKKKYKSEPVVREYFNKISDILGYDMAEICFGGMTDKLSSTEFAQPAIFTASVSQLMLFNEKCSIKPEFVAGNSIGEYGALYSAGVLTLEDAVNLVRYRAEFMDREARNNYGVMYDVKGIETEAVDKIVKSLQTEEIICISNYNGKNNVVVSGDEKAVNKAVDMIINEGGHVIKLNVSSGFHSPLMKNAADSFDKKIRAYNFNEPIVPVISNVTGLPYKDAQQIKNTLSSQITSSVKWYQSVKYMEDNGCQTAIEFGPKKILKNLIQRNSAITVFSYDIEDDRAEAEAIFDKQKFQLVTFGEFLKEAVVHKNCNADSSDYENEVVSPYRKIEAIYQKMKNDNYKVTDEDICLCRNLLKNILCYKQVESADKICSRVYDNVKKQLIG